MRCRLWRFREKAAEREKLLEEPTVVICGEKKNIPLSVHKKAEIALRFEIPLSVCEG